MEPEINNIASFNGKTVLIVEDDYYNAEYLYEVLSDLGLNLLKTESGNEAIIICLEQQVDLVLMDVRLPDISGYEATQHIKSKKPGLPIIAQTAYVSVNEKQKALNAGCDGYLTKPTLKVDLVDIMKKFFV